MKPLYELISNHEDWLTGRILQYEKDCGYDAYITVSGAAGRSFVARLSRSLLAAIDAYSSVPDTSPGEDYEKDPLSLFGASEARRRKKSGMPPAISLGMLKNCRRGYEDLILSGGFEQEKLDKYLRYLARCFDRMEVAFVEQTSEPREIVGILRKEILERIRVEESLKNLSLEFRTILDTIPDSLILLSRDLEVVWANRGTETALNKETSNIVGLPCYRTWFGRDEACPDCYALRAFKSCKTEVAEILEPGGRISDVRAVPIIDECGSVEKVIVLGRDITEKRKFENELLHTSKLESIGLLAGGIAHDLNNTLTGIILQVALAKFYTKRDEELFGILEEMEKICVFAKGLPQQLLSFSKGGMPVKKLGSIAEMLGDTVSFALSGSRSAYELSLPEDLWASEFDPVQISQAINNLVINARDAMSAGGKVEVSAENVQVPPGSQLPVAQGAYINISVRDHGVGIPRENIPKIFDPFFTTKQRGSGIGLATTYAVINKHGGYIEVESEVGVGTVFRIYLPATRGVLLSKGTVEEGPLTGNGRILVMEDNEIILLDVSRLLTNIGYEVRAATNGTDAIGLYRQAMEGGRPFDVVVLDLTIPGGMGGKECFDELRTIDPGIRAVVTSGYVDGSVMADFRKYGFCDAVRKPYHIEELSKILHGLTKGTGHSNE